MNSSKIKTLAKELGADLCGIATVDRFDNAPNGFKPQDLLSVTQSIIVFAKRLPRSLNLTESTIPYTVIDEFVLHETTKISYELSIYIENNGGIALPIPSVPYDYYDVETMTGKGLISFRHAGYLSGLGVIGRNGILNNPQIGNMLKLGVVLSDLELEPDSIIQDSFCSEKCNICIDNCPSQALSENEVKQKNCRLYSESTTSKGASVTTCYNCRKNCPYFDGWEKLLSK